jgi:hypothetical protein
MLIVAFCYNLFFVPISICFDYGLEPEFYVFDILAVLVNAVDILVKFNSGFFYESGVFEKNKTIIQITYTNSTLIIDVLAAVPIDYLALPSTSNSTAWFRMFRLLKFFRVYEILGQISKYSQISMKLYPIIVYFVMFIYLTHFSACWFFYIGKS